MSRSLTCLVFQIDVSNIINGSFTHVSIVMPALDLFRLFTSPSRLIPFKEADFSTVRNVNNISSFITLYLMGYSSETENRGINI